MQLNSPHPTGMRTGSRLAVVEGVRRPDIGKPDQWPPGSPWVRRRATSSIGKAPGAGIPRSWNQPSLFQIQALPPLEFFEMSRIASVSILDLVAPTLGAT